MEAVALLPLLVAVVLALVAVLAAGRAREQAGAAAERAAIAALRGENPRAHVPRGVDVEVRGGRVEASVRPPLFGTLLEARAVAFVPGERP